MKRVLLIPIIIPFLVGCNSAGQISSTSEMSYEWPKYVDGCPVKDKNSLETNIEECIYNRMTSDYCGLVHAWIKDEATFTKESITLYTCYDRNDNFLIVDYLINCIRDSNNIQPTRHNWGITRTGNHYIEINGTRYGLLTSCENEPIVYKDNAIYTIPEAYDAKIINDDYVASHTVTKESYNWHPDGTKETQYYKMLSFQNITYFYNFG